MRQQSQCYFRDVGRATVPAEMVGTLANPMLVRKYSFFFDHTGRSTAIGWVEPLNF